MGRMKQIMYILEEVSLLIALLLLFACSNDSEMNSSSPETNTNHLYKIVVNATKSNGESTRGLSLDGTTLNQKWNEGESVTILKKDGNNWTEIGTLTASASSNENTTLSGTVSAELNVNDELYLLFPRTTWDYTGQNGILYDESSETTIEKQYDYAQAIVYVTAIDGNNVTVKRKDGEGYYHDGAIFEKEQAITKFTFSVPVKKVTISASSGLLVNKVVQGTPEYDNITITASENQTVFYVSLRNDFNGLDTYTFSATNEDGYNFLGTKNGKMLNGKYYSTNVKLESKKIITVNGVSFVMAAVNGGTFQMGNTDGIGTWNDELPTHEVTLDSYFIGVTEVTQRLWVAIMNNNPSEGNIGDSYPVNCVSWDDCQSFITELNKVSGLQFRLPTEAEWEFAARGGINSHNYSYSGSNDASMVAWYNGNSGNTTHQAGTKPANELGIHDMSGNVAEWCQDWYGNYSSAPVKNPKGPETGTYRVDRGGNYCYDSWLSRVARRGGNAPNAGAYIYGLRLVLQ